MKPLCPRTLRWAARKAARYELDLLGFEHEAPDKRLRDLYERAAVTASVLRAGYLHQVRAIEKRTKKARKTDGR